MGRSPPLFGTAVRLATVGWLFFCRIFAVSFLANFQFVRLNGIRMIIK